MRRLRDPGCFVQWLLAMWFPVSLLQGRGELEEADVAPAASAQKSLTLVHWPELSPGPKLVPREAGK